MKPFTLWFTGYSGSGKTTIANELYNINNDYVVLDGDVLREGLCKDLGFSPSGRRENIRRLIEICKLFNKNGKSVLAAFISPYEADRKKAKSEIDNCHVIWCHSSITKCIDRDVKGLYWQALNGKLNNFTGISATFETPVCSDLILDTENRDIYECVNDIFGYLRDMECI
jgi:adenylylsulfate kinase